MISNVVESEDETDRGLKAIVPLKRSLESNDEQEDGASEDDEEGEENGKDEEDEGEEEDETDNEAKATKILTESSESSDESDESDESDVDMEESQQANGELSDSEKHSGVFSRFQQSLSIQDKLSPSHKVSNEDENEIDDVAQSELVPIPQPAIVRDTQLNEKKATSESKSAAWLNTTKVQYDNTMIKPFTAYHGILSDKLLNNIRTKFSEETFPIQTIILDTVVPKLNFAQSVNKKHFPRRVGDILVNASTGSGKTLAYSIPVIQCLSKRTVNKLRCLIVVPTKILIHQVFETLSKLSQGTSLITGISKLENSLRDEHRKFQSQEPDILVITPGRLVDHLQMGTFNLKNLKFLILDEADRLLNQSFQNWCSEIMNRLKSDKAETHPVSVIKMVFSATLTTNTEKLHNLQLNRPTLFMMDTVKLYHLPKRLQEYNINIPTAKSFAKPFFLLQLIASLVGSELRILVFVRSNEASIRLASLIELLLTKHVLTTAINADVASINSNNTKGVNNKLIKQFASQSTKSKTKVLIATDVMSRGIDIDNVTHIINYDLPISSQQYVHRCGRTARASASGSAFNMLVGKGEQKFWRDQIDVDLSRDVDGFHTKSYDEEDALKDILQLSDNAEERYRQALAQLKDDLSIN